MLLLNKHIHTMHPLHTYPDLGSDVRKLSAGLLQCPLFVGQFNLEVRVGGARLLPWLNTHLAHGSRWFWQQDQLLPAWHAATVQTWGGKPVNK